MEGIYFNGAHSWRDKQLGISPNKVIGYPEKEKKLYKPPYSNQDFDFSTLYGNQTFSNRKLIYPFNIIARNKIEMNLQINEIIGWLMGTVGKDKLYDDQLPGYYFMAEVQKEPEFEERWRDGGVLTATFDAYPFRRKDTREGSPYWDDYDITDIYLETSYKLRRTTFKKMTIGQTATVGAWSTNFDGGTVIGRQILGKSDMITDVRPTDRADSKQAYYLRDLKQWVIEQDIVEAQNGAVEVDLYNTSITSVIPEIRTTGPITIIRDREVFNLMGAVTKSDLLALNAGHNQVVIASGVQADVEILFYKEVI
ncbi:hypothetical protein VXN63_02160 [Marinilactibacillus sp. XAAS-LB27]|uniref:hypothetical protein n=1 Tax=Marinilactibacillus sp. XAAS-LB27 TaxID=3114538 RepID=UPI002E196027|nr:hypothetical protein [Marinilactibacillus sp. XAAS-LB27]